MGGPNKDETRLGEHEPDACRRKLKIGLYPVMNILQRKISGKKTINWEAFAKRTWEIAPGATIVSRPAYFLPGQLERVTGSAYTDDPRGEMAGGAERYQKPTRGFLLKDAWLFNERIYVGDTLYGLFPRSSHMPPLWAENEIARGAVYSSLGGNIFFGLWLTEDCSLYPLAANEGFTFTSDQPVSPHTLAYEDWLGMKPARLPSAFIRELVLFDDFTQNPDKRVRFRTLSDRILARLDAKPHPGVFILRRDSGKRRILTNELELADYLRARRGFRIVDVTTDDMPTIAAACAGALVVIGVEGSHLVHGIMVLQPGGSVLALQPPDRFCGVLKRTLDRDGQNFGFVVGHADEGGFRVDPEEVERTLDLLPTHF
jgi:hypothetical protein